MFLVVYVFIVFSIHAPTRGATDVTFKPDGNINISIHAPTRGATGYSFSIYSSNTISIHAPTRGATKCGRGNRKSCKISIHAPTRGATLIRLLILINQLFQSTLPREERRGRLVINYLLNNFNPRSHERSD